MVWRAPFSTGGPPVPTLFWALAFLALERWSGMLSSPLPPFPDHATRSKGLSRLQVQSEGQVGLVAPPKPSSGIVGSVGPAAWQADASEPRCRIRWGSTSMARGRSVVLLV